jgi:predicted enzyme related to lactoylglutathione lyase
MNKQPKFAFALEYVKDITAARRFYAEVLGLKPEREHAQFVQFENFAIASDEAVGETKARELYWQVEDAESAHAELSERSKVTAPLKQVPFGKVFGIQGPAGEPCYLVQFANDRPSRRA